MTSQRPSVPGVLVIYKKSAYQIYVRERKNDRIQSLLDAGDRTVAGLVRADADHHATLEETREACRELGVRFALDDFGTGYSTFTYLKRLPLDFLKVDRSFVHNMLTDRQDLAIVEGVIGLSETFGCKVVAEGVESGEQAQRLIELGCDVGQGNGIAEAMPVAEVYSWVRAYRNPFPAPQWADTLQ